MAMQWHEFTDKAYNGIYKVWWYPRVFLPNCKPVLVFSMAKSGSIAIRATLYRRGIGPVFWAHNMSREGTKRRHEKYTREGRRPTINRYWQDTILERYIEQNRPLKIISSVRDPIARDISLFFHRFKHRNKVSTTEYHGRLDELQDMFYAEYLKSEHDRPWFEREFEHVLGLNLYEQPFPHEQGYQILQHKQFEILLFRLETPDSIKEKALSEFFDEPNIKLYMTNIGAKKDYGNIYKEFKDYLKLPQDYVDSSYESREMQYFYTEEEISRFRDKWTII